MPARKTSGARARHDSAWHSPASAVRRATLPRAMVQIHRRRRHSRVAQVAVVKMLSKQATTRQASHRDTCSRQPDLAWQWRFCTCLHPANVGDEAKASLIDSIIDANPGQESYSFVHYEGKTCPLPESLSPLLRTLPRSSTLPQLAGLILGPYARRSGDPAEAGQRH